MRVVGEAGNGSDALDLVEQLRPDVLVLDLAMPVRSGIEVLPQLEHCQSHTSIVVLTVHEEQAYVRRVLAAGAAAYVLKRSAATELITAIRRVAAGGLYLDSVIASRLALRDRRGRVSVATDALTPREIEVATLIARGFGNSEIAAQLVISVKTVESHRSRLMEKMQFRSRADIVRYALAQGWLSGNASH